MLTVLDLFSGIGGFSLGLERAGMKTIAFCEIDPFCRKVLKKHWPDVPIFEDVRELRAEDITEPVDVICGGYPCQPFSLAGKRGGETDDRHLWPEYLRLIREIRPAWVIAENVVGHVSMGLDQVLFDLENEGYACWTFVIPACAVNAPHRRDRVWILGNTERGRLSRVARRWAGEKFKNGCQDVADTNSTGQQEQHPPCVAATQGHGARPTDKERGKAWWSTEPTICRVAYGVPNRVDRIRALGNSVVPQIPEIIGRAILEVHNGNLD